jgi:hypothetical protein
MPKKIVATNNQCSPACSSVVKFMTNQEVPPNIGINIGPYKKIDGFRYINLFVRFSQDTGGEPPVDLGVMFAFNSSGEMGGGHYVNIEENLSTPQSTNRIEVSGQNSWHGNPHNVSIYMARIPIMGPFAEVFVYNRAPKKRIVSVWGYLVS